MFDCYIALRLDKELLVYGDVVSNSSTSTPSSLASSGSAIWGGTPLSAVNNDTTINNEANMSLLSASSSINVPNDHLLGTLSYAYCII